MILLAVSLLIPPLISNLFVYKSSDILIEFSLVFNVMASGFGIKKKISY